MDIEFLLSGNELFMERFCRDCPEIRHVPGDEIDPPEKICPCDDDPFAPKCPKSAELNRAVDILEGLV